MSAPMSADLFASGDFGLSWFLVKGKLGVAVSLAWSYEEQRVVLVMLQHCTQRPLKVLERVCGQCCVAKPAPGSHYTLFISSASCFPLKAASWDHLLLSLTSPTLDI